MRRLRDHHYSGPSSSGWGTRLAFMEHASPHIARRCQRLLTPPSLLYTELRITSLPKRQSPRSGLAFHGAETSSGDVESGSAQETGHLYHGTSEQAYELVDSSKCLRIDLQILIQQKLDEVQDQTTSDKPGQLLKHEKGHNLLLARVKKADPCDGKSGCALPHSIPLLTKSRSLMGSAILQPASSSTLCI